MSDSARVGSTLGPYRLTRLIGRGGMGEVYEAEDTVKGRVVAVKLLPETLSHDPVFRERLQREARAAGRLQEPHVVPIHDFGEIDGHLFVDMRLIDGTDLATVLTGVGVMEPGRAVSLIGQVAAALDAAHAAGIAHRDVKPENILVTSGDFAYLVDFGIASAATDRTLTEKGSTIGTYAYMAPERFGGKPVTPSVDVYALACVLYQCLTGARPYPADNVSTLIAAHLMETPPKPSHVRPGIPASLDAVIAKGMAKSADERYPTAGALARAAEDALSGARPPADTVAHHALPTVPAAPVPELAAPARPRGRRALLIGGAFAVVAVVVAVGVIAWTVVPSAGDMRSASTTVTVTRAPDDAGGVPATAAGVLTPGERELLALVPDATTCTPNKDWDNAIAAVDCKPTASGDGHERGFYALYSDRDQLEDDFTAVLTEDQLTACPGAGESPVDWDYGDSPDTPEGKLACGSFAGRADIVWTKTSDLMLGTAQGNDMNALYSWWVDST